MSTNVDDKDRISGLMEGLFTGNIGNTLTKEAVNDVIDYGGAMYTIGKADGGADIAKRLKELVKDFRQEEDSLFSKDATYILEDLLATIEGL